MLQLKFVEIQKIVYLKLERQKVNGLEQTPLTVGVSTYARATL